ncbi:Voltage-dependent T-type calcium channel subunit alpha-1I [Collichthys lucidus]|uniref:Voltage-dependent T-type calcium channel subunit alpha-1I n=1 Tax=Collichthys lucidus TaxID=240159 RepID=A0A4U5VWJ7_COLLU|nr:Voltage-dependent T-type calcium channel subunit alpha-1I [Collichthys lucidus]
MLAIKPDRLAEKGKLAVVTNNYDEFIPLSLRVERDRDPTGAANVGLHAFDAFIYIFFALEMVVKMVALGIFGRRCYLGDTWNRLDFFIVMAGMVEYSLDLQNINLSAIRTVRVLRPLKAINRVPSMRILVNLLLDTLPMLGNVLLLCFFVFFIFGIIGVQLWAGLLRNRCYLEENFTLSSGMTLPAPYYQPEEDDERPFICSLPSDNGIMSCADVPARREGGRTCCLDREDALHRQALGLSPEPLVNGSGAGEAMGLCINWNQYYTRCHTGNSNPHKGAINFDNIVYAWIVIFQVITLEGWVEIMYYVMDAHSFYNFIYFILLIIVVSMGLYVGEQAYLRSSWNILDGFLVFVSLIDIVVSMAGGAKILGVLRVLRLLRTLRPLRVISRAPGLKLVVETLITSLKPIGNIVLICCAFFIIFGILGVQLFKGKFFYCFGTDVKNITNKSDCLQANYKWVHHKYNFDNLGQALMSLFVLASKDGWVNIMYHGLDAVGVDQQPVTNNNPWMLLYFISFLLIVSFFVLNMFVGVVVENFHKCRQHQEVEEAKRREEKRQRRMEKKRRKAQKLPYYASYGHIRLMIHTLCTNHYLDLIITFIICINVITMSLEHYNQPHSLDLALKYCNYFFTSTFVLESVLKLIAFGFRRFFKDRWNQLDLAIVLLSVMGITLEEIEISAALPINPTIIRIMRVLRIARVLKLLKMATGMRALLDTVVQALPQVVVTEGSFVVEPSQIPKPPNSKMHNTLHAGVQWYQSLRGSRAMVCRICNADYPCEGMSRHATFENFGMAFLTLFQVSTGDNWNGIMKDTLRECPPDHGTDVDYACNPSLQFISPMYFVSFVLTAQFVLINVVVAVLMKHLDDSNKEAQEEAEMDAEIELELAQGTLCCMGAPSCGGARMDKGLVAAGPGPGGPAGAKERGGARGERGEGARKMRHSSATAHPGAYSPRDSSRTLYSPAQHIRMAEIEQASLKSEQLSDKSSSPALPDDLSLDEHTAYQLMVREGKGRCSSDSRSSEEAGGGGSDAGGHQTQTVVQSQVQGFGQSCRALSTGSDEETALQEMEMQTHQPHMCSPQCSPEFFHPAAAAIPAPPRLRLSRGIRLTSPASWASLRSPGAHSRMLCTQYPSHSDSSLATGSSEGSLQTTLEEGLSFSVSPPQLPTATLPLVCPLQQPEDSTAISSPVQTLRPRPSPSSAVTLRATRGHQRSQSSGRGSTSPGYTRDDSIDPSDEDLGIGIGSSIGGCGSSQAGNSEHLSETLSSLSLTSLLSPSSLVYPGGAVKKCNSTGSLEQGGMLLSSRGREGRREILGLELMDPQGFLANPWTGVLVDTRRGEGTGAIGDGEQGFKGKSSSQTTVGPCRKNR